MNLQTMAHIGVPSFLLCCISAGPYSQWIRLPHLGQQ